MNKSINSRLKYLHRIFHLSRYNKFMRSIEVASFDRATNFYSIRLHCPFFSLSLPSISLSSFAIHTANRSASFSSRSKNHADGALQAPFIQYIPVRYSIIPYYTRSYFLSDRSYPLCSCIHLDIRSGCCTRILLFFLIKFVTVMMDIWNILGNLWIILHVKLFCE